MVEACLSLSKTNNGLLFLDWYKLSVLPHRQLAALPGRFSLSGEVEDYL